MLQNRNVMFGEVKLLTVSLLSPFRLAAWSPERLSSIWSVAFWTSISWVAAATLRRITVPKLGLSGPQYFAFAFMTTCDVVAEAIVYGPLPTDVVPRKSWAVSVLAASAAAEPPCAISSLEFRMPRAGFVTMNGIAGLGSADVITNV